MIQKVIKKHRLQERTTTQDDLAYWLSKTPEERVATVCRQCPTHSARPEGLWIRLGGLDRE